MIMRQNRIQNQLQQIRELSFVQVIECMPNGIECNDYWIIWIEGKKNSIFEGGIFPVFIKFPNQYPQVAPEISFPTDFKHVHIYQGGAICMPLLEPSYWKPRITMSDIIQRIVSLLHQEINPYSPANTSLYKIYKEDKQHYNNLMIQQSQKYRRIDEKYLKIPSIQIKVLLN